MPPPETETPAETEAKADQAAVPARDCTVRRDPWQRADLAWERLQEMRCDLGGDR